MMEIKEAIEVLKFRKRFYSCGPGDCPCEYKNLCDEKVDKQKENLYKAIIPAISALEKQKRLKRYSKQLKECYHKADTMLIQEVIDIVDDCIVEVEHE